MTPSPIALAIARRLMQAGWMSLEGEDEVAALIDEVLLPRLGRMADRIEDALEDDRVG